MEQVLAFVGQHRVAISVILLLGFLICLVPLFTGANKTRKRAQAVRKKVHGHSKLYYKWRSLCVFVVNRIAHVPVLGDILKNLSFSYVCEFAITEEVATYLAGQSLLLFCSSFVLSFFGLMLWFKDIILSLIASYMIASVVLGRVRSKPIFFLMNMQQATDDFIHAYHTHHGNLDEAFHAVITSSSPVAGHFKKMYEYIRRADVSQNPEAIQKEYYAISPARILRQLYSIIYMTYKYGDEEVNGESQFTKNIFEFQKTIADYIDSETNLFNGVFGIRWFIILPMFALPLLAEYMLRYFTFERFEFIEKFINSPWGYATEVLCAGISLLCFILYEKMTQSHVLEQKKIVSWENKVLRNVRIRKIVRKFSPTGKARARLQTSIMRAGSTETVEALTIRRVFATLLIFIICLSSVSINVWGNIKSISNNIYQGLAKEQYYQVLLTQDDVQTYIDEQTKEDKQVLSYIKRVNGFDNMSRKDQETLICDYMKQNMLDYRGYKDYAVQRILSKHTMIEETKGITNVLFVALFTLFAWFTPILIVKSQSLLNKEILISDETADLQSMTIMLINHKSCTPQHLLSWYADSSILFQSVFQKAIVSGNFSSLYGYVDYKPFNQLVECLVLSFQGMDMKEAFADIGQKKLILERDRTRTADKNVDFRIKSIDFFSSLSMGSVLGLYMFMPMLIAMVFMFTGLNAQLK